MMPVAVWLLLAQASFEQRGFLETPLFVYPQTAPGDSGRVVAEALFRYEVFWRPSPAWKISGGLDAQTDTHHQTSRDFTFSMLDRARQRQAFAARRLSVAYTKNRWTLEAGKQFIRWGRTDVLTPTDRFAPRDYLNVARTDFLPVLATRVTWGGDQDTVDLIYAPVFTPSRVPLLNQRWAGPEIAPLRPVEADPRFPGGPQFGARWNHTGRYAEAAFAFFEGFNHLPLYDPVLPLTRYYAQMRMFGGDIAVPLRWITLKGEAAHFSSRTETADEYWLYVIEAERQWGEWVAIGGYAGEVVTRRRSPFDFAPDRGLTRSIIGRVQYTIDPNRSLAAETAIRQNGDGSWLKFEYSQAFGAHWRATAGLTWIRGEIRDFLGQYNRNGYGFLTLRYSF